VREENLKDMEENGRREWEPWPETRSAGSLVLLKESSDISQASQSSE
jgi:hypothetical protein